VTFKEIAHVILHESAPILSDNTVYEGEPSFCNVIQGIRVILAPTGY